MDIFLRGLLCVSLILPSASAPDFKQGKLSGTVTDSQGRRNFWRYREHPQGFGWVDCWPGLECRIE